MDPAPRPFSELPADPDLGVPVPFACGTGEPGAPATARELDQRRVTQCALSRVCGICGAGLGRPVAFLGSEDEAARNEFHFPPTHLTCAQALLTSYDAVGAAVLGQLTRLDRWVLVTTGGFEFVRAGRDQVDRRPVFSPNSVLEERRVG